MTTGAVAAVTTPAVEQLLRLRRAPPMAKLLPRPLLPVREAKAKARAAGEVATAEEIAVVTAVVIAAAIAVVKAVRAATRLKATSSRAALVAEGDRADAAAVAEKPAASASDRALEQRVSWIEGMHLLQGDAAWSWRQHNRTFLWQPRQLTEPDLSNLAT